MNASSPPDGPGISAARARDVVDALRRGTVPQQGLGLFAVGLDRFAEALEDDLATVARGGSAFHARSGEYGSGKTFFARWLGERAKRRGLAVSEVEEHRVGENLWQEWWGGLDPFGTAAEPVVRHLVEQGYLERDSGTLFIGPEAERHFGHRHFMNLRASFTAPPEFTVLSGRTEIGRTDPDLLTEETDGPRKLLLAGRSWLVTYKPSTRTASASTTRPSTSPTYSPDRRRRVSPRPRSAHRT